MRVKLLVSISGTRDGVEWPPAGEVVDLPEHEARDMIAGKLAVEDVDVEAEVAAAIAEQDARQAARVEALGEAIASAKAEARAEVLRDLEAVEQAAPPAPFVRVWSDWLEPEPEQEAEPVENATVTPAEKASAPPAPERATAAPAEKRAARKRR